MGRGRNNRTWISDENTNLLFSLLIKDKKLIEIFPSISILSAISLINVLTSIGVKNVYLKWPNDVLINDKKVAGILLDGISENNELRGVIIGIGLNVNQDNFKGEYNITPTSLKLETGKDFDIKHLKNIIYKQLLKDIRLLKRDKSDYLNIANRVNYLFDKEAYALINNKKVSVKIKNINNDNTLKVLYEGKEYNLSSGEISFHLD